MLQCGLSDANINRSSAVFGDLYHQLYEYYKPYLSSHHIQGFIDEGINPDAVEIFDSSTISLFTDIFKGAGRTPLTGRKKGGLKIHTKLPLTGLVPDLVIMNQAAKNDKDFLGQLEVEPGKTSLTKDMSITQNGKNGQKRVFFILLDTMKTQLRIF